MVRSVTFEIRWHDTQPIYSCSFQPLSPLHLRRVLDHNAGQAAGHSAERLLAAASANEASTSTALSGGHSGNASAGAVADAMGKEAAAAVLPMLAGGQCWRVATAGGDNNARIWIVHPNIPSPSALKASEAASSTSSSNDRTVAAVQPLSPHPPRVEYMATLSRHTNVVNVVRFDPKGEVLVTAGDDGFVMFWVLSNQRQSAFAAAADQGDDAHMDKEHWRMRFTSRPTTSEIYDCAWSPSGESLVVGGTDFVARILNGQDGSVLREISEHSHHIQGVSWDPLNEYIATQSADRTVHVYSLLRNNGGAIAGNEPTATTSGITGTQIVSRNSRMDLHRRSGSGQFVWDRSAKLPLQRRGSSHASASERDEKKEPPLQQQQQPTAAGGHAAGRRADSARSATPSELVIPFGCSSSSSSSSGANTTTAVPMSPFSSSISIPAGAATPHHQHHPHHHQQQQHQTMQPPQQTPSRRSSFSGSVIEPGSPQTSITSLAPSVSQSGGGGGAGSLFPSRQVPSSGKSGAVRGGAENAHSSAFASGPSAVTVAGTPAATTTPTLPSVPMSAIPTGSISASPASHGRSPSPFPPLPAIRAPPSPRERMQATLYGGAGQLAKAANLRLYGDENFSGFFRRLAFSPDGALLVTPSGLFDAPPQPASLAYSLAAAGNTTAAGINSSSSINPNDLGTSGSLPSSSSRPPNAAGSSTATASTCAAAAAANAPATSSKSTVYMYARGALHRSNAPIAHLPGHKAATLVVRFSPILYELRPTTVAASTDRCRGSFSGSRPTPASSPGAVSAPVGMGRAPHPTIPLEAGKQEVVQLQQLQHASTSGNGAMCASQAAEDDAGPLGSSIGMFNLPYRMIFAVATQDSVWIYDTQQGGPICCFSNMHYASFTDLSWSPDGQTLIMSSTDGYCSVVVFDYGELGSPYQYSAQPSMQATLNPTLSATATAAVARPATAAAASPRVKISPSLPASAQGLAPGDSDTAPAPAALGLQLSSSTAARDGAAPSRVEERASKKPAIEGTPGEEPKPKKRRIAPTLISQ
ncbi:hypothetical protein K437DRAFT_15925 [Tilletiaria anomala UBC 951]|uniref:CAF1B/HIR1 beta-propeller domain-containing protein n=1 Tax=Tilletiaria anomala (strain ATCC 24038 / CBS 436.72 / UBC 951) TaxID=1037660 RepID=A0A066WMU5_TILAU|nr:uncharacterized protein K437DRAFT_15925 [Tilletiaria anomala UBC 951]KDN52319.1 hypothetical protein K437DRAFT_15925 [Tilletiaria anomala UBC 951]